MYKPPKKRSSKKIRALSTERERAMLIDQLYSPLWSNFSSSKVKQLINYSKERGTQLTSNARKNLSGKEQEYLKRMGSELAATGKKGILHGIDRAGRAVFDQARTKVAVGMIAPPYKYLATHDVEDELENVLSHFKAKERAWSTRKGKSVERYIIKKSKPVIEKIAANAEKKGESFHKAYKDWALKKWDVIKKDTGARDEDVILAVDSILGQPSGL